jgi:clan AA aspartic protease
MLYCVDHPATGTMSMGLTHITVQVSDLRQEGTPYEADFLVDTGAIDCMVDGDRLRETGVQPEGKAAYELANGEAVEYEYGFARVSFFGEATVAQVIFGPPGVEPILGAGALDNVGVTVDPATRTLKRLPARPLK